MSEHNCCMNDTYKCIEKKAYELWEKAGCPEGKDLHYWIIAEKALSSPVEEITAQNTEKCKQDGKKKTTCSTKVKKV